MKIKLGETVYLSEDGWDGLQVLEEKEIGEECSVGDEIYEVQVVRKLEVTGLTPTFKEIK